MKITSWGKYPYINADVTYLDSFSNNLLIQPNSIARGLGRSYGDSALASNILNCSHRDLFKSFDPETGMLTCESGVSFDTILQSFVPKGWFLPVTPGTKFVTVGGAIASDVHGKNHHADGSFSDHVESFEILTVAEGIIHCSRDNRPELFYATCGGMGLTGIILSATFKLIPIKSSYINQKVIKAKNLSEILNLFENTQDYTYSVAWIDCLSTGDNLGRSLLMLGEHATNGELKVHQSGKLSIPFNLPSIILNPLSIQAFNSLYFHRILKKEIENTVHYDPFFYPLDGIHQWNNMYGKNGFTQYQFVIPKSAGLDGLTEILEKIAESKQGSFLAVLKVFGKGNKNYLSFPMEGYTLALDFKLNDKLFSLLDELDVIVRKYQGRLYLTKDVRMSEEMFKQSYPQWEKFQDIREKYQADKKFNSFQSKRIGL